MKIVALLSRSGLRGVGPLLGLLATWVLFAVWAGGRFTMWSNQELMLLQTAVVGTAAVGATWIIVSGGIDLSVGANIALSAMVGSLVIQDGHGFWSAALATVLTSCVVGWLIGALVIGALLRVLLAGAAGGLVALLAVGPWGFVVDVVGHRYRCSGLVANQSIAPSVPLSPFIVTLGLWGLCVVSRRASVTIR